MPIRDQVRAAEPRDPEAWVGWCCSYCAAPLERWGHGLLCRAEGRWFATQGGVHRLLPEERRREILPFLELGQRVRRDEARRRSAVGGSPATLGPSRGRVSEALHLVSASLGPGPWRVLEVGAGGCAASVELLGRGHRVAAVGPDLNLEDGPLAAALVAEGRSLPRGEAEMDALPLEASRFDLLVAAGSLHHHPRLSRVLVELRRVTRRHGLLLVLDSPVYRTRGDGEAQVARDMKEQARRYGIAVPRENHPGYLVLGELGSVFAGAGWSLEVHGWPRLGREWACRALSLLRGGRGRAHFPILVARRDG